MIDIKQITLKYFQNSEEVKKKKKKGEPLLIKPILVKDYSIYENSIGILTIDKNSIGDIEIIKMSYLNFILTLIQQNEGKNDFCNKFYNICKLCLGEKNIAFDIDKGKVVLVILNEDNNIKKIINHKEFDEIIKIILNQNDANYDNRYISPEVKELMMEYNLIKYKNIHNPSLEERKAFVCSKIGKTFKDLNNMTYREFDLIYNANVNSEIYIGEKIIQGSYKYDVKEEIVHPLFKVKEDPYAKIFEDTNKLSGKGISGAEQLNKMNI